MGLDIEAEIITTDSFNSASDEAKVKQEVLLELNKFQHKMVVIGGNVGLVIGIFIVLALAGKASLYDLIAWYIALAFANLLNMWVAYRNRMIHPKQIHEWRIAMKEYHLMIMFLCLTWGSLGILYISNDANYQLYTITSLQLLLIGFSFGTVTDFTACVISNLCLLFPYLSLTIYGAIYSIITTGYDPDLRLSFVMSLILLSTFLVAACYVGFRLVNKFFKLSFENVALNKKLENMNKFLELRVKERTLELEKSLNLVTYQATHDLLTDLPNQRLLLEYLEKDIRLAEANTHGFAVVFFSLNEIEKINDGLGHQAGDLVIQTIAQRFLKTMAKAMADVSLKIKYKVVLSRKDVFVIVLDPIVEIEEVEKVHVLFSVIEEPIYTGSQTVKLTASMGVSLYPRDGKDIQTLLMNADAAMRRAKQLGGNSLYVYQTEFNANISKQLEVERNLFNAVKNNELLLQYQPFISLETGKICGAEALVRWNSPELGFISPVNFIALAEANGMIVSIGEWVMRTAFLQVKEWHNQGFTSLRIAINLSAKQLYTKNILQTVITLLQDTHVTPEMIEFELTESEAFQEKAIPILQQLKHMGIPLSIDDFGTGYSGLTNLKQFNIDKLKIDQSFVRDVVTSADSQAIVGNTIALGKKIGVTVLAEGVETKEQLMFLQEHHCDLVQGYYFSPPVSADALTEMLKNKVELSFNNSSSR